MKSSNEPIRLDEVEVSFSIDSELNLHKFEQTKEMEEFDIYFKKAASKSLEKFRPNSSKIHFKATFISLDE